MSVQRLLKGFGVVAMVMLFTSSLLYDRVSHKDYLSMTTCEIMEAPIDELAELSIEDLIQVSDKFKF